ncbi:MAG: type VI secretion system tube protein Hcp [Rhodospirillaceae bacterium]
MDYIILDLGDDVKGESTLDGVTDKIVCLSYSHGVSQPLSWDVGNAKRTTGRPQHQDMVISKLYDKATPALNYNCCIGKAFATAKLTIYQMDEGDKKPKKYIEYEMTDAIISSISVGGGGGQPSETLSLNYSKIKWWYTAQDDSASQKGNLAYEYDLTLGKAASA